jgi:hypothetical protein
MFGFLSSMLISFQLNYAPQSDVPKAKTLISISRASFFQIRHALYGWKFISNNICTTDIDLELTAFNNDGFNWGKEIK